jgi:protein-disulfide isomerase
MNKFLTSGAVALTLIAGGVLYMTQPAPQGAGAGFALPGAASAQETAASEEAAPITIEEMTIGNPDATVEIIEYASYTCPHCANANENQVAEVKKNYVDTGKVKFTYREVYFDKYGMWGSMIARCAGPEKFFGITDMIYKDQDALLDAARKGDDAGAAEVLRKIGRLAGIEDAQLEACMADGDKLRALLTWFQTNAEADGINSTPTFLINGEKYSNMNYKDFAKVLDEKLGE